MLRPPRLAVTTRSWNTSFTAEDWWLSLCHCEQAITANADAVTLLLFGKHAFPRGGVWSSKPLVQTESQIRRVPGSLAIRPSRFYQGQAASRREHESIEACYKRVRRPSAADGCLT